MPGEIESQNQGEQSLEEMKDRMNSLEQQLQSQADEIDALKARLPDTHLINPNFFIRAFTVWGHYVVAGFLIAIPFMCLAFLFVLVLALFGQYSY
jgi:hypothetical protein